MVLRWQFRAEGCPALGDLFGEPGTVGWLRGWERYLGISNRVWFHRTRPLVLKRLSRDLKDRLRLRSRGERARRGGVLLHRLGLEAPRCFAHGTDGGDCLLLLERLPGLGFGNTLRWVLAPQQALWPLRERLMSLLAEQVGLMHQVGIVHGDLRLNNVLVSVRERQPVLSFVDNDRTRATWRPERELTRNLVQLNCMHDNYLPPRLREQFFLRYRQCGARRVPASHWPGIVRRASERVLDTGTSQPPPEAITEAVARLRTQLTELR